MTNQTRFGFSSDINHENNAGSGNKPWSFDASKAAANKQAAKRPGGSYLTEERFRQLAREEGAEHILPTALSIFVQESGGGRTTATSTAKVLDGVVKARKDKDGKPEAYKIAVGEGFDETLYTVAPGAILLAGESADENEADEHNEGGVSAGL